MGTWALFINQFVMKVMSLGTSLPLSISPVSLHFITLLCIVLFYKDIWLTQLQLYVCVCVSVNMCMHMDGDQVRSCPPLCDEGI